MIRRRLLLALDMPSLREAEELAHALAQRVGGVKVGLELCTAVGVPRVIQAFAPSGLPLFLDLKFKDIPNTIAGAVRAIRPFSPGGEVAFLTLHCDGGSMMLRTAVETIRSVFASSPPPRLLGVTVLTSLDAAAMQHELGIAEPLASYVVRLALLAKAAGMDGVVASPHEVAAIRQACGPDFLIVTPGVRPVWAAAADQRRTMTPAQAIRAGADYLVIGRPVTSPPPAIGGPVEAMEHIIRDIAQELTANSSATH